MKFTRFNKIETLTEGKTYTGIIFNITKVAKCDYYEVQVKTDEGIIYIWVNDTVNPLHPLFLVFDAYIDDEDDAEDFDEKDIVGTTIEFTVKNLTIRNKKGDEVERSFFNKVTPIFDETEEEEENE